MTASAETGFVRLAAVRCPKKGDMRTRIDKIRDMWEQLSSAGVHLSIKDKSSIVMRSLPPAYASFISSLSAAAHMNGKTVDPETLITYLLQEYNCLTISSKKPSTNPKMENAAMAATFNSTSSSTRRGNRGG
ncbi:hypothetical protein SERLA73DRAFT_77559 [Serpula lacrymans var. lacrymans S7.3]|uniref:Uncharacterized protein n=2 Tax=Serpula lacrymans var. lacrymans TaxID=341189 RepID=F8QAN6_SERL3|nr:uncharacterized protein SERLADRAFT_442459 [Serpula lacrymans var. lacrymans S7.9]EGN94826.1 hypothetical protein SERLA73DRAFT_77559 [Serpula lacrymans var. lacrymans S7.3]EGO20326.1 hypothetical protein SERLADRAFT_442459 [Serpula lacrymans var. lacrymans S7.9]